MLLVHRALGSAIPHHILEYFETQGSQFLDQNVAWFLAPDRPT